MSLAFSASQDLQLPVEGEAERLCAYLNDEERVVGALLDPEQLEPLGPGRYRYRVTQVRMFHLRIQPIVELQAMRSNGRLELEALDCQLEGLGLVEDFRLDLSSWLAPGDGGLVGEATLSVTVSQPALLQLIPSRVLEASGRSVLGGILLGIKNRVAQQLLADFQRWCETNAES